MKAIILKGSNDSASIWRVEFEVPTSENPVYRYFGSKKKALEAHKLFKQSGKLLESDDGVEPTWSSFDDPLPNVINESFTFYDARLGFTYDKSKQPIDLILDRSGKNRTDQTVRGTSGYSSYGSTRTMATFNCRNRDDWISTVLGNRVLLTDNVHMVVVGDFLTWSHLPKYTLDVKLVGFCDEGAYVEGDDEFRKGLKELVRPGEYAFVFELKWVRSISKALTWCGAKKKWKKKDREQREKAGAIPVHNGKELLGFIPMRAASTMKKKNLQKFCRDLAAYAVDRGKLDLFSLTGEKVSSLLYACAVPQRYRPNIKHRILDAAKFHRKSELWTNTVTMFPATIGQYFRDTFGEQDGELRQFLFRSDGLSLDYFFYGKFDWSFEKSPYQVQVETALRQWAERFPDRMIGWEQRFHVWKVLTDTYYKRSVYVFYTHELETHGSDFLVTLEEMTSNGVFHEIDAYVHNHENHKKFCFCWHYNIMGELVHLLHDGICKDKLHIKTVYVGARSARLDGYYLLYPNEAVRRHYGGGEGMDMQPYISNVHYKGHLGTEFSIEFYRTLRNAKRDRPCLLVGLEYWPADGIAAVLDQFKKTIHGRVDLHFFGYDSYPKLTMAKKRLIPLYECLQGWKSFSQLEHVTLSSETGANEHMIQTEAELAEFIQKWKGMTGNARWSWESGYGIVVNSKAELLRAKQVFKEMLPRDDTKFHAGGRVLVKRTGVVSHVKAIILDNFNKNSIGKHVYQEASVRLEGCDQKPTELESAYVMVANKIVTPVPNMILFGKVPNYLLEACQSYLAKNLVLVCHESLDDELSKQGNYQVRLSKERETCMPYWIEKLDRELEEAAEAKEAVASEQIRSEREAKKRKLFAAQKAKDRAKQARR